MIFIKQTSQEHQKRLQVKSEIFDHVEGLYNRIRRHNHLDQLSPHEFEQRQVRADECGS